MYLFQASNYTVVQDKYLSTIQQATNRGEGQDTGF